MRSVPAIKPADGSILSENWAASVTDKQHRDLAGQIETMVARIKDELIPQLRGATVLAPKFFYCAKELDRMIDEFDRDCAPPQNTKSMSDAQITKAFDRSFEAAAKMFKELYRQLKHADFNNHHDILILTKDIASEFEKGTARALKGMDLGYYEIGKLLLTVDSKLGFDAPDTGERYKRRRSLSKDPDQIEAALIDCLTTIIPLREKIMQPRKQDKFDELVLDSCAIFGVISIGNWEGAEAQLMGVVEQLAEKFRAGRVERLTTPEEDEAKGERIKTLLSACAMLQKIYKWVRKVDLQRTEMSSSRRQQVIDVFDGLKDLALGSDVSPKEKF